MILITFRISIPIPLKTDQKRIQINKTWLEHCRNIILDRFESLFILETLVLSMLDHFDFIAGKLKLKHRGASPPHPGPAPTPRAQRLEGPRQKRILRCKTEYYVLKLNFTF